MPNEHKKPGWTVALRFISFISVIVLFVVDYGFDVMAKEPPVWAYALPGLFALGVENRAVARLVLGALRVLARIPEERKEEDGR